jgi:hypothetical protein
MPIGEGDPGWSRARSRLLDTAEVAVREANRAVLHEVIPELTEAAFMRLAVAVARLRGDYLATALTLGRDTGGHPTHAEIESIAHKRLAYDEARLAFEALQRAISRGYVDIGQGMAAA